MSNNLHDFCIAVTHSFDICECTRINLTTGTNNLYREADCSISLGISRSPFPVREAATSLSVG